MKMLLIFLYFLTYSIIYSQALNLCSKNTEVITDFGPEECDATLKYYEVNNDCFPECVLKRGLCEQCSSKKICAPGLKCDIDNYISNSGTYKCILDELSCAKYKYISDDFWKPKCLPDGTYAAKQCKGEKQNGRCYCYDEIGNKIFGQEWSHLAENMTCACSRRRAQLERNGREDVTLHCDSRGNYEPLQCDQGLCWCAEPKTGEVVHVVVPETMMTLLPCYTASDVGLQYLRKCESLVIARAEIRKELETHGTLHISYPLTKCDWDGGFGPFRIQHGSAYCTWRDDSLLDSFQSPVDQNTKYLTCNCARDKKLYKLAGIEHMKDCEPNGSYKEKQEIEGKHYCVDSDGFSTTKLSDTPIENCPKPELPQCNP